jgi:hypothetical protein
MQYLVLSFISELTDTAMNNVIIRHIAVSKHHNTYLPHPFIPQCLVVAMELNAV